jgi:ADP-heptose:LPS heptosyltransferase
LADAYPQAQLGMLLPSWSREAVAGHQHLRWIHTADHWKSNRAAISGAAKWARHRDSAARAIREISEVGYDVAIDLYAYYPNFSRLLSRAGVPVRVGYTSGGAGPLYTHAVDWDATLGHTALQHRRLVQELIGTGLTTAPSYDLPALSRAHPYSTAIAEPYVVIHPGTGDAKKAWPAEHWRALVEQLAANGERIVITGVGSIEHALGATLANGLPSVVNVVGELDWIEFRAMLAGARLAIGVDSVAMHLAAAADVPVVSIAAAMSDPEYWRPLGANVVVLTKSVPCAPCFRSAGCAAMSCVRDVPVAAVLDAVARFSVPTHNHQETEMHVG